MDSIPFRTIALLALPIAAPLLLAGCSGGGNDAPAAVEPTVLTGTAAVGAPMAGATILVIDADPSTADPAPVTTAADGSYKIDVSGLKAPLLIKATGTADGAPVTQYAAVPSVTASALNVANVTPLTNAIAALVAPGGDAAALATVATLAANATAAKLRDATALMVNTLRTDAQTTTALGSGFDPLATAFKADGTGIDGVFDRVAIETTPAGVTLTNMATAVNTGGVPASVTLTAQQTATPTSVPTLPPTANAANIPTVAELAALGAKYEACLALPATQRVTMDAAGNVTAVLGACNFVPSDWRSNGRTFLQEVGQFTLAKGLLTGAKVGRGVVALALDPEGHADPTTFKHPYCNDGPCAVVRWPLVTSSGATVRSEWLLGKVAGQWNFVGNQRPYRVIVETRLNRLLNVNRDGPSAGNTSDAYFFKDRYESVLRLQFDLASSAGSEDIRNVRVSGPGLPTAGVVLARSQRCGTDDRMAITYQNGSTRTPGNQLLYWTGGSAADFVLDAANLDGSSLGMPTPVLSATSVQNQNFSPAPVANQSSTIPVWSRYKVEIFRFSTSSEAMPDEVLWLRINAAGENARAGASKSWPTLDSSYIDASLKPGGANAGSIDTFAGLSMPWTAPSSTTVLSSYLFSQNFATATNAQNETASFAKRSRVDYEPTRYGDTVGLGWQLASPVAGTSLSSFTQTAGTNPNPRCGSASLVPLTLNANDYREVGLTFRGADRKLYNAIWYWDN